MVSEQSYISETTVSLVFSQSVIRAHIVSDTDVIYVLYFLYTVLAQAIGIFGTGSNVINIICFVKQGFKDSINISLLGLAVSDLGCLTTLIWTTICYTPALWAADVPFDSIELQYLTGGMPHTVFTRVTGWITAFIALERCMCITVPLQVKRIITPRRVTIITVSIFIVLIASVTPEYMISKLDWKYVPYRNRTIIGIIYDANRQKVAKISYIINNVVIPLSSCLVVMICTTILVLKLKSSTDWRKKSTRDDADTILYRNQKVSKMVVFVSTLFIVCFIPVSTAFIVVSLETEFHLDGKYRNLAVVIGGICLIIESINSSVNIFIYYHMSKNYRLAYRQLFNNCTCVLNNVRHHEDQLCRNM